MKIVVASQNPVKIAATKLAFEQAFPAKTIEIADISVPSLVSDQPMSEEETQLGAFNRALGAMKAVKNSDFVVGIEGGLALLESDLLAFAWVVIMDRKSVGRGRTASFLLPPEVAMWVKKGKELGEADDIVFGTSNSKQQQGAIGLLTGNLITRTTLYQPAVTMALIPFLRPDLYPVNPK